jgi:hypothetical protein
MLFRPGAAGRRFLLLSGLHTYRPGNSLSLFNLFSGEFRCLKGYYLGTMAKLVWFLVNMSDEYIMNPCSMAYTKVFELDDVTYI